MAKTLSAPANTAHGKHQVHTLLAAARARDTRPRKHAVVGSKVQCAEQAASKARFAAGFGSVAAASMARMATHKMVPCKEAVVVYAATEHTSFCEQVGSELGCNGLPPLSLAVSPGVAKVGHDGGDGAR